MLLRERLERWTKAPAWTVTACVALFYLLFTVVALGLHDWDPLWFAWIGERFAELDPAGRQGYDGQFVHYIATLGKAAIPHLDSPAYRLQRILLPLVARGLHLMTGLPIAWTVPLINFVAIVLLTEGLATWLAARGRSPWYALTISLYVGVLMAYSRNLTEPLALCLAARGVFLWDRGHYPGSALLLALAFLTKEITAIFAAGLVCSALARRDPKAALWPALALLPLLLWEGYLTAAFGRLPFRSGPSLEPVLVSGILPHLTSDPGRLSAFLLAGLPALLLLPISLAVLRTRGFRSPAPWLTAFNALFVLLLPLNVYDHIMHAGRNAGGLLLALVFLLPLLNRHLRRLAWAGAVLPTLVWLIPILRWAPWLSRI